MMERSTSFTSLFLLWEQPANVWLREGLLSTRSRVRLLQFQQRCSHESDKVIPANGLTKVETVTRLLQEPLL